MGLMQCEIHGITTMIKVCSHVKVFVADKIPTSGECDVPKTKIWNVTIKTTKHSGMFCYCEVCREKHINPKWYFILNELVENLLRDTRFSIEEKSFFVCIQCLYKELFDVEIKWVKTERGGKWVETERSRKGIIPYFKGNKLLIVHKEENK